MFAVRAVVPRLARTLPVSIALPVAIAGAMTVYITRSSKIPIIAVTQPIYRITLAIAGAGWI